MDKLKQRYVFKGEKQGGLNVRPNSSKYYSTEIQPNYSIIFVIFRKVNVLQTTKK